MEKGEVVILAGQFAALVFVVLLLVNFVPGVNLQTTPSTANAYWGAPSDGVTLSKGHVNTVTGNASTISVYFKLVGSTGVSGVVAGRVCTNSTGGTGEVLSYTTILVNYDGARGEHYVTFGPVNQPTAWSCKYTVTVTDSLQQSTTWTATVKVKSA